jgi:RHH-type transcriptional regulator, proline utilization regulon repressor / proline dehydrogenase / delta 1-pyrroline-5-carboxylate dehydrogenase
VDINRDYCTPEAELLPERIELIDFTPEQQQAIEKQALELATAMQESAKSDRGLSSLLYRFSLSSNEGQALMHLAEALLRIPDNATATDFMVEKIAEGDWEGNIQDEDPLLIKAVLKSLAMAKKLSGTTNHFSLPIARQAINHLATRFVMGKTLAAARRRS